MKVITPKKLGTELASFLKKNPGAFGSVIIGKNIQKGLFRVIWREK